MPGLDLDFGPVFWALLPAFLLTAVIGTIRAMSSNAALQQVSWRRKRPVDFRAVQGTVTVDGMSNLLCGLAGTVPNTTYSLAAPLIEITGVAARVVAVATGAIFLVLAFLPKALAGRAGDTGPGRRRLSPRPCCDAVHGRHRNGDAGRHGLPQGHGGRGVLLARSRFPERRDLPRAGIRIRRRNILERDHFRRSRRDRHDLDRGFSRTPSGPHGNRVWHRRPAENPRIPRRFLQRATAGKTPWQTGSTPLARRRC